MDPALGEPRHPLLPLLDIVETGVFTLGPDSRVRCINRAAERILGYPSGDAVGLDCHEVLGPHLCVPGCAIKSTLADRRTRADWAIRLRRHDGTSRDVIMSTAFLTGAGEEPYEVAITIRDVTEAEQVRRAIQDPWNFHGLICASAKMKEIAGLVREMAPYESTVLLLGESGTGKEIVARAIHAEGPRADRAFVTVNCSAYSEGVLESELFGHARGSFTGAVRDRAGRFEEADGGTVLLDEIGEIPPAIQVKLLRVLQEREVERVGDSRPRSVDIRVIAATNRDIREEVRRGRFREDLYYRLNVISVHLPPLRGRLEDVPALADQFIPRFASEMGKEAAALSDEALDRLLRHDWPGNVRELENTLEHAVLRSRGRLILPRDLPSEIAGAPLEQAPLDREARVDAALKVAGGRLGRAAEILGVHRTTLWRWLQRRDPAGCGPAPHRDNQQP